MNINLIIGTCEITENKARLVMDKE